MKSNHHKINYLEFQVADIEKSKAFYNQVFGWTFIDYGPDYCAIEKGGIDGGFYQSEEAMDSAKGSALIVIYSSQLEATQKSIEKAGGKISKAIFSFPGGRRFHFLDISGNEFAVWSE